MTHSVALLERLRRELTSYKFNSDYRAELASIDNLYATCRDRLEGSTRYVWRAICQYRSQASARSRLAAVVANALAILFLPFMVFWLRPAKDRGRVKRACEYLKMDFHPAYQVPQQLRARTLEVHPSRRYLALADIGFALRTFVSARAPYPELLLKFLLWIATVRPLLDEFAMRYLIQYCEYSAHSSLRKLYLNAHGVMIANVTHGEELISTRSAFSSFDQYFAWEVTPAWIHAAMRIEYSERFTFNPCEDLPRAPAICGTPVIGMLWPAIDDRELESFIQTVNSLSERYIVILRRHPNPKYANRFAEFRSRLRAQESDARSEGVHSFIDRTSVVVGYMSAVLLQAALRGREVIYLRNAYLASLAQYHDYYRSVTAVQLSELVAHISHERSTPR